MFGEEFGGPGGGVGGGADDEFSTGAEQGGGSFDNRGWRPEAAGGYETGETPMLLACTEALGGDMEDFDTL